MAEIGGYEWSVTCDCGQTIGLSGLRHNPIMEVDYEEYDILRETRIRSIEGTREFECPSCGETLRIGVEVGRSDERIEQLADEIARHLGPIEGVVTSGKLPDVIERTMSKNMDTIESSLEKIRDEVSTEKA